MSTTTDAFTAILQKIEAARPVIEANALTRSEADAKLARMDEAEAAVRAACPACPEPIPPEDD